MKVLPSFLVRDGSVRYDDFIIFFFAHVFKLYLTCFKNTKCEKLWSAAEMEAKN